MEQITFMYHAAQILGTNYIFERLIALTVN